jgi:hypothetical protein
MASWEQTLKQHLTALFSSESQCDQTLRRHTAVPEPPLADGPLPSFFMNESWDLGKSAAISAITLDPPKLDKTEVFASQRRCRFRIQQSDSFGVVLEHAPEPLPNGLLVVTGVDCCSAFARTETGGCGLLAGDIVLTVNGKQGNAVYLQEALRKCFSATGNKTVDLVVRSRPPTFNIELRREGAQWQKLGIVANPDLVDSDCLVVDRVRAEGLVPLWNAAHGSLRICKGDLMTHVNGVSRDADAMMTEIQRSSSKGSTLRFRILTPQGMTGCHKDLSEKEEDLTWPETTVPWDMQVRWLDDTMSDVSTTCGSGHPSGTRTPEDFCPSGARTPELGPNEREI